MWVPLIEPGPSIEANIVAAEPSLQLFILLLLVMMAERHAGLGGYLGLCRDRGNLALCSHLSCCGLDYVWDQSALALTVLIKCLSGSFVHLPLTSSLEVLLRATWVAVPFKSCPWISVDLGIAATDRASQASFLPLPWINKGVQAMGCSSEWGQ